MYADNNELKYFFNLLFQMFPKSFGEGGPAVPCPNGVAEEIVEKKKSTLKYLNTKYGIRLVPCRSYSGMGTQLPLNLDSKENFCHS